jgi:hypothetical protein
MICNSHYDPLLQALSMPILEGIGVLLPVELYLL